MKIIVYCQHVLGIGHFIRTLSICHALYRHELLLVTGGEPVNMALPSHVTEIRLPSLMMDEKFQALHHPSDQNTLEKIKALRTDMLWDLFKKEAPDLFIVELYPFGRKAFRFELDPVLKGIHSGALPSCRVLCSVRDVLVEKEKAAAHEKRAINILNQYFDALLIHADPKVITLAQTFAAFADIAIPAIYTGYVSDPPPAASTALKRELKPCAAAKQVVVSVGGGKVGGPLLRAIAQSRTYLPQSEEICFFIFTGPFAEKELLVDLRKMASNTFHVHQFSADFPSFISHADLSISMAGYNTCMNLLAAKIPALVFPFQQNREQGLRARRLSDLGALGVLSTDDLKPRRLAGIILSELNRPARSYPHIDINGARNTARWIEQWIKNNTVEKKH